VKELVGHALRTSPASPEQCLSLLAAVDGYPNWYPEVVRSVEVVERDDHGQPTKVRTKLHVERGPLTRDFNLLMDVRINPAGAVMLRRVPHDGDDGEKFEVIWRLSGAAPTQIRLDLAANLNVPRFVPLGDVGDSMAVGFVNAATRKLGS
jgi:Polyketide cyclase / dehydrase and lipid transport